MIFDKFKKKKEPKKVFPPVPDWKPDIAQPIDSIIERIMYYTNNKKDIAVFRNGTCVVLNDGLSDSDAQQFAKEVLHQIYNYHPDMKPMSMDDENILIQYNHPAVNVVLDSHVKEHWNLIALEYQKKRKLSFDDIEYAPGYARESELNLLGDVEEKRNTDNYPCSYGVSWN